MYYLAQPPPLVGSAVHYPGSQLHQVPHGAQNEYGYRTTNGMGAVPFRTGLTSIGALASGTLYLSYFRACKAFTALRWDMATATVPFAATPTLMRGSLYSVDSLGNLILQASSVNDTTIGLAGNSKFGKVFSSSFSMDFGRWYAFGFLAVTPVTSVGTVLGPALAGASNVAMLSDPRMNGVVSGLSDLPATVTAGSVAASNQLAWAELS